MVHNSVSYKQLIIEESVDVFCFTASQEAEIKKELHTLCILHFFYHVCLFPIPLCICFLLFWVQPHYWPALFTMMVGGWSVAQLSHLSRIYFHRGRRFNHFCSPCLKKDGSLLNHPYLELTNYCVSYCVCEHVVSLGLSLCANVLQFCCVLGVYVKTRLCFGAVRPFCFILFVFIAFGLVGPGCC